MSNNKCKYCKGLEKYITPHQASENDYSKTFIIGDTLIIQSFSKNTATAEINVDISFCPFCGNKIIL